MGTARFLIEFCIKWEMESRTTWCVFGAELLSAHQKKCAHHSLRTSGNRQSQQFKVLNLLNGGTQVVLGNHDRTTRWYACHGLRSTGNPNHYFFLINNLNIYIVT